MIIEKTQNSPTVISPKIPSARVAVLEIKCEKHSTPTDLPVRTNVHNYLRSHTGIHCCGNSHKSDRLTGRQFSPETLARMSESAKASWQSQ